LLIAQLDLSGKELADAGLMHTADTGQLGLSGARFEHHLAEQITSAGHDLTIALSAIEIAEPGRLGSLSSEVACWQQIGNTRTENGPTRLATTNHAKWV
jgi:hypothetical protein